MILFLDNAESILDPQGADTEGIYALVKELSHFDTISLCITSRIWTVPPHCNRLKIPTLSMESACNIFYGIYKNTGRSDIVEDLVRQLDFHPLSITLLATTAVHTAWDYDRLAEEWDTHRAQVLRTEHNESLAATIELSLTSPTFQNLSQNARELLGVVAFFPQGIDEKNLDWLFPTISDRKDIFDKFCVLSLTHRSNGFITMLGPLRDYLGPEDPTSSPLLCTTKDLYFSRLRSWVELEPGKPGFTESQWIASEDVNAEHLLNIFTSFATDADNIWDICANFIMHLRWHKPRTTVLRPKVEALSDDHRSKPQCLLELSRLFRSLGNYEERKRLLKHVLELEVGQGNDDRIARTLRHLAAVNRTLQLCQEGVQQSKEALEIYERLGDAEGQAKCWDCLARLWFEDKKLDDAEEAGSHAIDIFLDQDRKYWVCVSHLLLGRIYHLKHDRGKAIQHFSDALKIASSFDCHDQLFWIHYAIAELCNDEDELNNAQAHVEQATLHAADNAYCLGRAIGLQARILRKQGRLEEAKAEVLRALEIFGKLKATTKLKKYRKILREIELEEGTQSISTNLGPTGEPSGYGAAFRLLTLIRTGYTIQALRLFSFCPHFQTLYLFSLYPPFQMAKAEFRISCHCPCI